MNTCPQKAIARIWRHPKRVVPCRPDQVTSHLRYGTAIFLIGAAFSGLALFGQSTTADVTGSATDASGAVLSRASVELLNID